MEAGLLEGVEERQLLLSGLNVRFDSGAERVPPLHKTRTCVQAHGLEVGGEKKKKKQNKCENFTRAKNARSHTQKKKRKMCFVNM